MNKDYNFTVKLTLDCPGNCKCCTNRQKNFMEKGKNKFGIFNLYYFKEICRNIKKLNGAYICLSGGEPTIVNNIDEYINIAHQYGLATRINTNGWGITKQKLSVWLDSGLDQVVLSVYSLNSDKTKIVRGNQNLYKKMIDATKIIKEAKEKTGLIFVMQTVIMKENYREIPEILEFAIDNNVDRFWASYLEDAINLKNIRMEVKDIKNFKEIIIPKMKNIIEDKIENIKLKKRLLMDIDNYYNDEFNDYIYHKGIFKCPFIGKSFTFYPNGNVDPCPGHEYFKSNKQILLDYNKIDEFMNISNLNANLNTTFKYCKYCPHGIQNELFLKDNYFHERSKKVENCDL